MEYIIREMIYMLSLKGITLELLSEAEIWSEINEAFERMSIPQRQLWEVIKITPEKWQQDPWGNSTGGFWVVAIIGQSVIWYNEIEEGFNRSKYSTCGKIDEYWCNQDELEHTIQQIINEIKNGYDSSYKLGPPEPIE